MRLALLPLLAACGAHVAQPEWRREPQAPAPPAEEPRAFASFFTPSGEPAVRYADGPGTRAPATGVELAVARTAERWGHAAPLPDARLIAVAEDLARLPPVAGGPPADVIQFALSHHGLVEPSPYLLIYGLRDGDSDMETQLEADLPDILATARFTRLGVGRAPAGPGATTLIIALQEGGVELHPVARELPRDGRARVRGRVLPPFKDPKVYVARDEGAVVDVPVVRDGEDGFRADVVCAGHPGKVKVEVMAEDRADNPTVLANFPIWCGEPAPRTIGIAARAATPSDAGSVEAEVFRLANLARERAGIAPLVWSEKAAAVARLHSTDMRDHGFVAHVSPSSGTPADRAKVGGVGTPLLLENLARAQSAAEAHLGLMDSPGHRSNLMNPLATHVGVGVALPKGGEVDRDLYVTQLFFRVTPARAAPELRRETAAAIAAARAKLNLGKLALDEDLDRIAQTYAAGLAAGRDKAALDRAADLDLDRMSARYFQVVTVIAVVGDPADAVRDAALDGRARTVGVGAAQGPHAELGEGAIHVVTMFGRPR